MKTCDVCKRDDGYGPNALSEDYISSVHVGTSIQIARAETQHECPVEIELCSSCIETVNAAIGEMMQEKFGVRIRK